MGVLFNVPGFPSIYEATGSRLWSGPLGSLNAVHRLSWRRERGAFPQRPGYAALYRNTVRSLSAYTSSLTDSFFLLYFEHNALIQQFPYLLFLLLSPSQLCFFSRKNNAWYCKDFFSFKRHGLGNLV